MLETAVEQHVLYALRNATVKKWPFPHFFAEHVFPPTFYEQLLTYLAAKTDFSTENPRASRYANRTFALNCDVPGLEFMSSKSFLQQVLAIFAPEVSALQALHNDSGSMQVYRDIRLIRDGIGYKIGPHTDAKWKMVSLLFYLPATWEHREYGTSLYVPKDPAFRCVGGPHYPFEPFERVHTAPFVPNTCLGFWKTDHSFHGVEPIPVQFPRDVLLFNIYRKEAFDASHPPKEPGNGTAN